MQQAAFARQYVILRPVSGSAGGFLRLEMHHGRISACIRATQIPGIPLRALLLAGDPATGAVIDLGLLHPDAHRQAHLCRDELPSGYSACHTVVICTDWPDAALVLHGSLTPRPACTLWQLQESIRQYLSVPARGAVLPAPAVPPKPDHPAPALCMLLPR